MRLIKISIVIIVLIFLSYFAHQILLENEKPKIVPYGRKIQVFDKKMNVVEKGIVNKPVIVIDPGYGTIAPGLDFGPLIENLATDFHVYAIEPFGYGDSDITDSPRTIENINREFHQAIEVLGIDEYILCAHSISGVYSIDYLNKYPKGVVGFIGLDTSVPNQFKYVEEVFYPNLRKWGSKLGLVRWISRIYPQGFMATGDNYSNIDKDQIRYRLYRDFGNRDNIDEGLHFKTNWDKVKDRYYPKNIKTVFFLRKKESEKKNWRYIETKNSLEGRGEIYLMEGSHYIHRDNPEEISEIIKMEFL